MTMTPAQQAIIISQTAQGVTTRNIAPQVGTSHVSVFRAQQRLRDHINRQAAELLNRGLIPARRTITRLAAAGNSPEADGETRKLSLDASKVILNAAGILSQGGTTINALIQINQQEVPEAIAKLFAQIAHNDTGKGSMLQVEDAIDV